VPSVKLLAFAALGIPRLALKSSNPTTLPGLVQKVGVSLLTIEDLTTAVIDARQHVILRVCIEYSYFRSPVNDFIVYVAMITRSRRVARTVVYVWLHETTHSSHAVTRGIMFFATKHKILRKSDA